MNQTVISSARYPKQPFLLSPPLCLPPPLSFSDPHLPLPILRAVRKRLRPEIGKREERLVRLAK